MSEVLTMKVAGKQFEDFMRVSVTYNLEDLAGSFDVGYIDRRAGAVADFPVREGDLAELFVDGELVMTGWVEIIQIEEAPGGVDVRMSGRSIVCDLVDCSATGPGRWRKTSLLDIAKDLCMPLGIEVVVDEDPSVQQALEEPFRLCKLRSGETVHSALKRYAEIRGVVMTTNPAGELVFTRPGLLPIATGITRGENVLSGSRTGDFGRRYSHYIVRSQSAGDDTWNLDEAEERIAMSEDEGVRRYRPMVMEAEKGEADLFLRADWQRSREAGRSRTATYRLQGWKHRDGLWAHNRTTQVRDPRMAIEGELLIIATTFTKGLQEGTVTEVKVGAKEGWDPYVPPKKPAGNNANRGAGARKALAEQLLNPLRAMVSLSIGLAAGSAAASEQRGKPNSDKGGKGWCKEYDQ